MRFSRIDPEKLADDRRAWIAFPVVTILLAAAWVFLARRFNLDARLAPASGLVFVCLAVVASATDAVWKWVFNWTTYPAMLLGLGLGLAADVLPDSWVVPAAAVGAAADVPAGNLFASLGLGGALLGLFTCGFTMLALHVLFPGGGGGDVKLCAAIGSLLGWWLGLQAILYGFIVASLFAVLLVVWRLTAGPSDPKQKTSGGGLSGLAAGGLGPMAGRMADKLGGGLPMGPFFAAGAVLAILLTPL